MQKRVYTAFKFTILASILLGSGIISLGAQTQEKLDMVLSDLYQTFGNYQFTKPELIISEAEEMGAGYFKKNNTILIEKKMIDLCRTMQSDSTAALYFIIGHELTHFYQEALSGNNNSTNFLAYTDYVETSYKQENEADLHGAFLTYLCGYELRSTLPELIDKIYKEYQLENNLRGYPPKNQRLHAANQTLQLQERMIDLYDNSILLMLLTKYDLAREGFQSLLKYYQGYEVKYNIGLTALLEAIYFPDKNIDPYFFPIEINDISRLHKPLIPGGEKDLNLDEMWHREILLNMARTSFVEVQRTNPTYIPSYLGFITVLILEKDYTGARTLLEKTLSVPGGKSYRYDLMLLEAIINASEGQKDLAETIFQEVEIKGSSGLRNLAKMNRKHLNEETVFQPKSSPALHTSGKFHPVNVENSTPILLTNGTKMFDQAHGKSRQFTYLGHKSTVVLKKDAIDLPDSEITDQFISYPGQRYTFYFQPENHICWKVLGNRIVEKVELFEVDTE